MMKGYLKYCILFFFICGSIDFAAAYTGECKVEGGTITLNVDVGELGITDPSANDIGKVVISKRDFNLVKDRYQASCDIPKDEMTDIYFTTTVPLRPEGDNWFSVNDYISIKTRTSIEGLRNMYIDNPMRSESNLYAEKNGNVTSWLSGHKGDFSIKIKRKFIGIMPFHTLVAVGYANAYKDGGIGQPMYQLYLNGSISVPQTCELDAGTTVTMDFGNIGAPLFSRAGAGNKPDGINPKSHNIAIKCKNIDAQALLSMRLESSNVSGNIMVSDNKDVGFIVADQNNTPLTPNNIDSKIKFQLDDNATSMVFVKAWPVSVTGNKPAEGRFTAEGYLRVDFD